MSSRRVAVIGGGFSGTLAAIHLLGAGLEVTLIERTRRLARGVAYSTRHAEHLLNVRAAAMSAFPDDAQHFAGWLERQDAGTGATFAERRRYGSYLEDLLAAAAAESGDRLRTIDDEAVDVVGDAGGETVRLADGAEVAVDFAILAVGNLPPEVPRGIDPDRLGSAYVADPWAGEIAAGLGDRDTVLLVGTGLTAIDAALMLDAAGFGGRTIAISRRGLVPRAHADPAPAPALEEVPEPRCTELLRSVRARAGLIGWRAAVDQLRPVTQSLWAGAGVAERRRFLRHLRPYWDVHRHRIAPEIAERIEAMVAAGRLSFNAGKIISATADELVWRRRGSAAPEKLAVGRIVNCTGPQGNIARAGEPLLSNLLASGRIRPDSLRIGIDVEADGRTLGAAGEASQSLYAIGPMTRGAFWEIVAVPDIRVQAAAVAQRIAAAP